MVFLLLACTADEAPPEEEGPREAPVHEPEWSADEALQALNLALSLGTPAPAEPAQAFLEALSHGDDACPGNTDEGLGVGLPCTSADGYFFSGIGAVDRSETGWGMVADFEITRSDGSVLTGGGETLSDQSPDGKWILDFHGTWLDTSRSDWLGQLWSGLLFASGSPTGPMTVDGGSSIGSSSLYFDGVVWEDGCPGFEGSLEVRDEVGGWYAYTPDGPCEPCGRFSFGATDVGEACLDFSPVGKGLTLALPGIP